MPEPQPQEEEQQPNVRIGYVCRAPTLRRFHRSKAPVRIITGPVGSGKTSACIVEAFLRMTAQKPDANGVRRTVGMVIRNICADLTTATIPSWDAWFGEMGFSPVSKVPPYNQTLIFRLPDSTTVHCQVYFLALDRPQDVKKLRGINATWCLADEVKELPLSVVEYAFGRCGRFPSRDIISWYGLWGATNAPAEGSWLYKKREKEKPDSWEFYNQPGAVLWDGRRWVLNQAAENLENLVEGYYKNQLAGGREDYIKVNLGNQYGSVIEGKAVIEAYDDTRHVCTGLRFNPALGIWIGVDFGLTPAALFGQRDLLDNWQWLMELTTEVGVRQGTEEFARVLKPAIDKLVAAGHTIAGIFGDPAGEQEAQTDRKTPFAIFHAHSIPIIKAPSNDFAIRRAVVNDGFASDRILVGNGLTRAREGLRGGYAYRQLSTLGGELVYSSTPSKTPSSHVVEAGGYMMLGAGEYADVVKEVETKAGARSGFDPEEVDNPI